MFPKKNDGGDAEREPKMTNEKLAAYKRMEKANLAYSVAVAKEFDLRGLAATRTTLYYKIGHTAAVKEAARTLALLRFERADFDAIDDEDAAADAAARDAGWNC